MSDPGNRSPGEAPPPVPRLIDVYKSQREALREQSRDLARLRQEIRGTAEREAQEIVDAARSNVRQILVNARRELLVLAAQVQAAIDDPDHPERQGEQPDAGIEEPLLSEAGAETTDLIATRDLLVDARHGMHDIIHDARPHLETLADEARALRGALAQTETLASPTLMPGRPAHDAGPMIAAEVWPEEENTITASAGVPAALTLSLGRPRKDAVPAAPLRTFVLAFAVLSAIIVIGTLGWLRMAPSAGTVKAAAPPSASPVRSPQAAATPARSVIPRKPEPIRDLTLLSLQARRDVWIRTTIDGRGDTGKLLRAGDTQEITGAREVSVRAGDAGALWVSVNGSDPTQVGRDGEVLTRRFALRPPQPATPPRPAATEGNQGTTGKRSSSDAPDEPVAAASGGATANNAARPAGAAGGLSEGPPPITDPLGVAKSTDGRLVAAAERWLDAYYRGEQRASADAAQPTVKDERGTDQRLPPRLPEVRRTLDDVRLQLVGDSALITAKMTEQSVVSDRNVSHDSLISQMWMRSGGAWRLVDVRIISEPKLRGE